MLMVYSVAVHIVQMIDYNCPGGELPCLPLLKIWGFCVELLTFYDAMHCNMALTSVYGLAKGDTVSACTFSRSCKPNALPQPGRV